MPLTREQVLYEQMKVEDKRQGITTEPYETTFFFPTPADAAKAKKWLKKPLPSGKMIGELSKTGQLRTAFTLVAQRVAVPAAYLEIVRGIEARIEKVRLEQNAGR
jgi:competence transcription factor ComK